MDMPRALDTQENPGLMPSVHPTSYSSEPLFPQVASRDPWLLAGSLTGPVCCGARVVAGPAPAYSTRMQH